MHTLFSFSSSPLEDKYSKTMRVEGDYYRLSILDTAGEVSLHVIDVHIRAHAGISAARFSHYMCHNFFMHQKFSKLQFLLIIVFACF